MKRLRLYRYLLILLLPVLPAAATAWLQQDEIKWSAQELNEWEILLSQATVLNQVIWVDARSQRAHQAGHYSDAVLLNEDQWDELLPQLLAKWQPENIVIVYCGSTNCKSSKSVADRLKNQVGFEKVYVLKGGWEAIVEARLPQNSGE